MRIALDTEDTGLDFHHGARPFYVTVCDDQGNLQYWEWDVDPLTRKPKIPKRDLDEIEEVINECDELVFQNAKFDIAALGTVRRRIVDNLDWSKVHDTLLSSHLLTSNQPHDLTTQALVYLDINLKPLEVKLKEAVNEARRIARSKYPSWRIASDRLPEMPSAKEGTSCFDYWLPRAIAHAEGYAKTHPWFTVLRDYSNADPAATIGIHIRHMDLIEEGGLSAIYEERRKLPVVLFGMEDRGIGYHKPTAAKLKKEYTKTVEESSKTCVKIASKLGYELTLPKGSNNNSLLHFCFGSPTEIKCETCKGKGTISAKKAGPKSIAKFVRGSEKKLVECEVCEGEGKVQQEKQHWLKLPTVAKTKTGNSALDKVALDLYLISLKQGSNQHTFIENLVEIRKRGTALGYMESYQKFCVPTENPDWFHIHPSLNATGTATLRMASQNPNEQQISNKGVGITCPKCKGNLCQFCSKDEKGEPTGKVITNLRELFGPLPGREWWSLDYQNIELRIPAYESGEEAMIELFEKPNDPPYFGSYHLLNASIIFPELFWPVAEEEGQFKKLYLPQYKRTKNTGFAIQYGCQETKADATAGRKGAFKAIKESMPKIARLTAKMIAHANKYGYVETLPDREVDPGRGYPLFCSRSSWGGISPTIPLSYHVQGSACWIMMRAMIKVREYLSSFPGYHIAMNVHDEMVFDFPKGQGKESWKTNLPKIRKIQRIMESCGTAVGIPLTTSCEYHEKNWGSSLSV